MTSHPHTIRDNARSRLSGRRIEIRWTSMATPSARLADGVRRGCFVIAVEPVKEQHALLECWLLEDDAHRAILPRQTISCAISEDASMTHLDAFLDGRRVLALTIRDESELLYAQSPLPAEAGLAPGACDPATVLLRQSRPDAVSA